MRGERLEAELVVAAAVEDDAPAHAGQVALGRRARLELDDLAGRRVGRGEVLDARQRQADGALEAHAGGGRQRLGDHQLAPEGAAQRRRAHAHAVVRPAEQVGQLLARAEGALRARADHEPALGLEPRGGHLRLHVALVDPARAVAPARARRAAGQRRLRVADGSCAGARRRCPTAPPRRRPRRRRPPRRARRRRPRRRPRRHRPAPGAAPGAIDDSRSSAASSGSMSTTTSSTPSAAAASRLGHDQRHGLPGVDDLRARQRLPGAPRGARRRRAGRPR